MARSKHWPYMTDVDIRHRTRTAPGKSEGSIERHYHNDCELIFIVRGRLSLEINGCIYTPGPGCIVFIGNMDAHGYRIDEYPYERYVITFKQELVKSVIEEPVLLSIFQHRPANFQNVFQLCDRNASVLRDLFHRMFVEFKSRKSFNMTYIRLGIYQILIELYRIDSGLFPLSIADSNAHTFVTRVQAHIQEHYTEAIDLKSLSTHFYTDMYYLCHLFKAVTGFSIKNYLIQYRISRSKDLLVLTSDDMTMVGSACGFQNVNHFIRTFRRLVGITPYQYRKKALMRRPPVSDGSLLRISDLEA